MKDQRPIPESLGVTEESDSYKALVALEGRILDVTEPVAEVLNGLSLSRDNYRAIMEKVEESARAVLIAVRDTEQHERDEAKVLARTLLRRFGQEQPDEREADWDRVRRSLDEAIAAVVSPNVKEIKRLSAALRGWAEGSEYRDGELTVEEVEFVVRVTDALQAAARGLRDTEQPDEREATELEIVGNFLAAGSFTPERVTIMKRRIDAALAVRDTEQQEQEARS